MTQNHCDECGKALTNDEQLMYGWSCTECEQAWQKEINKVKSELAERL